MASIKTAIYDLLDNPSVSLEAAVDRHFAPGFRQRVNGHWYGRSEFLERIRALRAQLEKLDVRVLDEVTQGNQYAERHVITLRLHDGQQIVQEVYLFAQRAHDGRFTSIEETALSLLAVTSFVVEQQNAK